MKNTLIKGPTTNTWRVSQPHLTHASQKPGRWASPPFLRRGTPDPGRRCPHSETGAEARRHPNAADGSRLEWP